MRVARKKPFLWPQHKMNHLKYAKENTKKPEAFWKRRTPCQLLGGSIMLWGCVAAGGTGNIVLVEGRLDSTKYKKF